MFRNTNYFSKYGFVFTSLHMYVCPKGTTPTVTQQIQTRTTDGEERASLNMHRKCCHTLYYTFVISLCLMRAGHHGGVCAFLAEVAHKRFIKTAAKLSRTYGSRSRTEREMLKWTLADAVYEAAIEISAASEETRTMGTDDEALSDPDIHRTFRAPLQPFMNADRSQFAQVQGRTLLRVSWERKMISKSAKVTRKELLTFICEKLALENTRRTRTALVCTLE